MSISTQSLDGLLGLRKCLFPPDGFPPRFLDDTRKKIEKHEGKTEDPQTLATLKDDRSLLPLKLRTVKWVFQDLYDVIDEAVNSLPEEHKLKTCLLSIGKFSRSLCSA